MKLDEGAKYDEERGKMPMSTQEPTISKKYDQAETQSKLAQVRGQAHEHLRARRWSQASELFLELLQQDGQDEDALLGIATALDGINRFEPLYNAAQNILEINPNSAHGLAYKARALQKMERFSEATIANDQALLLDTSLGLAWINRCGLQLLQQKFPEALRSSQRAIELAPDDPRSWTNKGIALLNFNRLGEALEAFDRSLELDPDQLLSLQMKGELLCRMGRMREVLLVARQALTISPTDTTALTQGILALRALEMYEPLIALTKDLIKLIPDNLFAWENTMRGLRGMGKFEEANEVLNRLLEMDPANFRIWTLKADTLYRLERYREAVNAAARARQLEADYPPANRIHEKSLRLMYQKKEKRSKNQ